MIPVTLNNLMEIRAVYDSGSTVSLISINLFKIQVNIHKNKLIALD